MSVVWWIISRTINEGQQNMSPPLKKTIVPLYWFLSVFVPHTADVQRRIIKIDSILAEIGSVLVMPSENGDRLKQWQGKWCTYAQRLILKKSVGAWSFCFSLRSFPSFSAP